MKLIDKIGESEYRRLNAERVRVYNKNNPDKKQMTNKKWNEKNRKEYQREYRRKQKLNS